MSDDKKLESRSIGKLYAGEKAIISITSWKMRIDTVSKTLYSLLKQCPGFHIVLVLSEEEFPLMEKELPKNLMLFVENELIEILWIYPNWKSFKKVLPTMDKYRDVPVISADDDCIYICNYAQELYDKWLKNKECVITNNGNSHKGVTWSQGPNTLFPPNCFDKNILNMLEIAIKYNSDDDALLGVLYKIANKKIIELKKKDFFVFHDEIVPLRTERRKNKNNIFKDVELFIKLFIK